MNIALLHSNIRKLESQSEVLKSTVREAHDAHEKSDDALSSIAARADAIHDIMNVTQKLQNNHTEMVFAIGKKDINQIYIV